MNESHPLFADGQLVAANEHLDSSSSKDKWVNIAGRQYKIEKALKKIPAGRTADTFLVTAHWDKTGEKEPADFPSGQLVLKVPKLDQDRYTREDTVLHVARIQQKASIEIRDIAVKLRGVVHANPLVDAFTCTTNDDLVVPLTVQRYLSEHISLREWLSQHVSNPEQREAVFVPLALVTAHALETIHSHRVTHGDINPDNVFISKCASAFGSVSPTSLSLETMRKLWAQFIDFGESFPSEPGRNYRPRKPHPYLAPEWLLAARMTEAIDVYSFGRMMLFIATGDDTRIVDEEKLKLNEQQSWVEETLRISGVHFEPRGRCLPNLIAHCLSADPAARPRMSEVVDELRRIWDREHGEPSNPLRCEKCGALGGERDETIESLQRGRKQVLDFVNKVRTDRGQPEIEVHPLMDQLLSHEIDRVAAMCSGLARGMLEIQGTREHILRSLVCLFDELKSGDSLTVATSLDMWQRDALGLGGRLGSATVRLARRGGSLRRALIVSVHELGIGYVERLIECLRSPSMVNSHPLQTLADRLELACSDYFREIGADILTNNRLVPSSSTFKSKSEQLASWILNQDPSERKRNRWYQDRLFKVVRTINDLATHWSLQGRLNTGSSYSLWPTANNPTPLSDILFTLVPVGTVYQVEQLRADNPAAVVHYRNRGTIDDWILVTVDGRGSRLVLDPGNERRIHLDRLRVFKSVHDIPKDRKTHLQHLFNGSVNLGACHSDLLSALQALRSDNHE